MKFSLFCSREKRAAAGLPITALVGPIVDIADRQGTAKAVSEPKKPSNLSTKSTISTESALGSDESSSGERLGERGNPERGGAERMRLAGALHHLVRESSQGSRDVQSLQRVCELILAATPTLRLVWIGFCQDTDEQTIGPTAYAGAAMTESAEWALSRDSFDFVAPYKQRVDWQATQEHEFHALFSPWKNSQQECSVTCALAIPLHAEKSMMHGMIVFYADDGSYFKDTGVPAFQALAHVCEIIWKQSHLTFLLTQHARLDRLTGLLNRQRIAHAFTRSAVAIKLANTTQGTQAHEPARPFSILYCYLHDFSKLSALYGWVTADNLLASFATATLSQLREDDKGGRWGTTEFLYILPDTDAMEAAHVLTSFIDHFKSSPVVADSWTIRMGFSVGAATYGIDGVGLDELLQYASQNMRHSTGSNMAYDSPAYQDAARWRFAATTINASSNAETFR
ncbi:GGDEF domain-containing protein [Glaciimonas immobilis]|uniref:Diguanylate cyclase (GGDEF)-like protein n=1 Tax=Glaciimonas immobilis TaxID=728004 RepID=A0A840RP02_9BURK|nr:GGDEF domain-containing protein [Glaciimonas immobilis]KAF3999659.1 GGDEF domain-containing protein [Glaciimonas immobilis]MBB5200097.1 diguanylate cyclase (GGDEF)-like protein [Glaciimonas immobilis]